MKQNYEFVSPINRKFMSVTYTKKMQAGKVTDGFPLKRSLKSEVVYRLIRKDKKKKTVIITSEHSRLSYELPYSTIVYV